MKEEKQYYYKSKFIIIGDAGVGKTNLVHRFAKGEFISQYAMTLGMDFLIANVEEDGKTFKLELWDTAGSEKFRSITKGYYKNATCAIIVYDISNKDSFLSVNHWIEDCKSNITNKNIHLILVGNKCDLTYKREVEEDEGKSLAENQGMSFYETSALTGVNVDIIFFDACKVISKNIDEGKYDFSDDSFGIKKCLINQKSSNNKRTLSRSNSFSKNKNKKKCCQN